MSNAWKFILLTAGLIATVGGAIGIATLGVIVGRTVEHHIRNRNANRGTQ